MVRSVNGLKKDCNGVCLHDDFLVGNVNNSAIGRTVKRKTANNLRVPKDLSSEKEGSARFKMNANRCGIGDKVEVVTLWPNNEKRRLVITSTATKLKKCTHNLKLLILC